MATTPAVCEHVHLPVQSGSDAVLRRMLRRYTRARYLEVVAELRAAIPGITFSTDIIVGFPGETDAQFEETLSLVTDAEFDDAYTFKYSVARRHAGRAAQGPRARRGGVGAARAAHRGRPRAGPPEERRARGRRRTRCWSSGPRAGATSCWGAPARNQLVLLDLPPSAAGEYHRCRLTGTTGSTFTGAVVTPALAVL